MSNDSGLFVSAPLTPQPSLPQGARGSMNDHDLPSPLVGEGPGVRGFLPLYEAKMVHQFDHRWASYDGANTRALSPTEKANPDFAVQPRYWVPKEEVEKRLHAKGWERGWLMGWRDITNATNERTVIAGRCDGASVSE